MPMAHRSSERLNFENSNIEKCDVQSDSSMRRLLKDRIIQDGERKLSYKSKKVVIVPRDEWTALEEGHDSTIEVKTFDLIQWSLLSKRTAHSSKNVGTPNRINMLDGKVKCLGCGGRMRKGAPTRDGASFHLRCGLVHKPNSIDRSPYSIRLDIITAIIEDKIRAYINEFLRNEYNLSKLKKHFPGLLDDAFEARFKSITAKAADYFVDGVHVGARSQSGEQEIVIYWTM